MIYDSSIQINGRVIGLGKPTYFIADIAANHDGDLARAIDLIHLAKESGADAAKFQHFEAKSIVSDYGFKALGGQQSHQSTWNKTVYEVYQAATVDLDWTETLVDTCKSVGIDFFTSPYSPELVDFINPYVPAFKVGSGDITWIEQIEHIALTGKPVLIAAGASSMDDVVRAVEATVKHNPQVVLMQCNTNYTASLENFRYIQLNVLKSFSNMYPGMVLGLSDHTPGHSTVLGAVALGASMIEKHFTDEQSRIGPDHRFSMSPVHWKEMVDRTRELELALGSGIKTIEQNEMDTVVIQRRATRAARSMTVGDRIGPLDLEYLRPCPVNGIPPYLSAQLVGGVLRKNISKGDVITIVDVE